MTCPECAAPVEDGERYCESCGADLVAPAAAAPSRGDGAGGDEAGGDEAGGDDTGSDDTGGDGAGSDEAGGDIAGGYPPGATPAECAECGGRVAEDGYCEQCGARAATGRDHFAEQPADWLAGVCDRGRRHKRNEDALALAALGSGEGRRGILVVCDGVSSALDSDVASLAAARTARDALVAGADLAEATRAAHQAVVATTSELIGHNPPSATLVAAVLAGDTVSVGSVGDSRAYWLPDGPDEDAPALLLTTDDSWAAEAIAAGIPRADAERAPGAHAITRWLGIDSPDWDPRASSIQVAGPGWLLVCSDGLWNYCSAPADLAALVQRTADDLGEAGRQPAALAEALVAWANEQGGHDNITVALARVEQESS